MKKITKWILALMACTLLQTITVMAASGSASVTSCVINPNDITKVSVEVQVPSGVQTDDDTLYLFAVPTYVDSVSGQKPVAAVPYGSSGEYSFSVDLNNNTASSLLYSKFYVGVKSGGAYAALTDGSYITNPEVIATNQSERNETASKKGLQISFYIPTDLEELGIKQSFFNICLEDIISNTETNYAYTYNGKTYYFNPVITDYDTLISNMTKAGMSVTVALVNEYRNGYEYLIHPGVSSREGSINYAINTSTQQGLETVAAAAHFLADRYGGNNADYGKVENWIVGNEVNDNLQYYYMGEQNVDTFVQEYLQSFRVIYTAVKSAYNNANVYMCLEHRWTTEDSSTDYGGKSFIDKFNSYAKAQGDMDWGLAYHPYSFPLSDADILNDGEPIVDENGKELDGGEVLDSPDSPIITMKNIGHLTDYFRNNAELRNPAGEVRSIILSEQGYTSYSNTTGQNEAKQAANIALAYYIAEMNEDIDAFILRGHSDEYEGSIYYKFGLWNSGEGDYPSTPKYAYEMYKYIDTAASLTYTEFAKPALNITDWSDVVNNWNENAFAAMGTRTEAQLYIAAGGTGSTGIVNEMWNQWKAGYNVFTIGQYDYEPIYYPEGVAVANPYAYYIAYQGVEKCFDTPLNLSDLPYLTFEANFKPKNVADVNDKLELKVRLHSGGDVYDAAGIVEVNKDYTVCLDLSQWAGRSSVNGMEVLIREYGQEKSFDGTFTVYNVSAASSIAGMEPLEALTDIDIDLSDAEITYQTVYDYNGTAIEPEVAVKVNGQTLVKNTDYDVIYHDNIGPGEAKIVVVGIGDYSGYTVKEFAIKDGDTTGGSTGGNTGGSPDTNPDASEEIKTVPMYRLFNPNSGEHFYTGSIEERDMLIDAGWNYEGVAWNAPVSTGAPVYRMYNPNSGDHHYTMSQEEVDMLKNAGWAYEGVCWNSASADNLPLYRLYNPNADCGSHHYTGSEEERDYLVSLGWKYEGIGWYGMLK